MKEIQPILLWIARQDSAMRSSLRQWCQINSGSENLPGLAKMSATLQPSLQQLGGDIREIELPPRTIIDSQGQPRQSPLGRAISLSKRPEAPHRVFLAIHMDTIYGPDSPFQAVTEIDPNRWCGPGVADAKGGLVVMFTALAALERSDLANRIGWEVLINPDEEIGSPGSAPLFAQAAQRNHIGLVFEPALADGNLVSSRKGSWSAALMVRGKSAHVGRDITAGRNAIHALAQGVTAIANLQDLARGIIVNVGKIDGGGPTNVVPDLAICRFNVRTNSLADYEMISGRLRAIVENLTADGISAELHWTSACPPKPVDDATQRLFDAIADCGKELGLNLSWRPTGGVCDGNRLAAAGLPTIDTLGVRGGDLHSPSEYVLLDSLVERASLSAMLLLKIAAGEIALGRGEGP
jgi:glutamate carboxypeptidase